MKYDVIIVGAGPAGLMAGRVLNNKCNFLIIDSKKEIGIPLKCGEGVKKEVIDSFFKERPFVKNIVNNHEIKLGDYSRVEKYPYYKIDREKLEKHMAKNINKSIILNTKFIDIKLKKDYAEVITNTGRFTCLLVIVAYGANFNIQRKFNLVKGKIDIIPAYGGIYKKCALDPKKFIFDFYDENEGYFWIFPENSRKANIGLGSTKEINIKKVFLQTLNRCPSLKKAKALFNYSSIVPCSGPINQTYFDRLLFCGDAAGFTFAGTGEGIMYALKSGKLAAETALLSLKANQFNRHFLKSYEKKWKKEFGNELKGGLVFYDLVKFASKHNFLKRLFSSINSKELYDVVNKGKFPLRAIIFWRIIKLFNL